MVFYRKYKNFRNDLFRSELENELSNYDINNIEHDIFLGTFLKTLDKYAPMKKKYLRANHATFMTKEVRKAIMMRSKLRNKFLQDKVEVCATEMSPQNQHMFALKMQFLQQSINSVIITASSLLIKTWRK